MIHLLSRRFPSALEIHGPAAMMGNVDFSNLFFNLSGGAFSTLAEAQEAGAPTIN